MVCITVFLYLYSTFVILIKTHYNTQRNVCRTQLINIFHNSSGQRLAGEVQGPAQNRQWKWRKY